MNFCAGHKDARREESCGIYQSINNRLHFSNICKAGFVSHYNVLFATLQAEQDSHNTLLCATKGLIGVAFEADQMLLFLKDPGLACCEQFHEAYKDLDNIYDFR